MREHAKNVDIYLIIIIIITDNLSLSQIESYPNQTTSHIFGTDNLQYLNLNKQWPVFELFFINYPNQIHCRRKEN